MIMIGDDLSCGPVPAGARRRGAGAGLGLDTGHNYCVGRDAV